MSDPIQKIGVIGCGGRVRGLLAHDKRIQAVAICDPHPESIRAAREELNPGLKVCESPGELLAMRNFDWVAIGSWNSQHREHAVAALEAGKHVFCEKPIATNLDDALAIRDAVQRTGRMFSFGLVLRYSPFYSKIHDLLRSGEIGQLISFEFNETLNFFHGCYIHGGWRRHRANAGTHMLEKCCHDLDISMWLVDSLPSRVASFGGLNFFKPENMSHTYRDSEGREIHTTWPGVDLVNPFTADKDIVDNQVVLIEYANGVRASFHTNCMSGIPERRMVLIGTKGAIRADALTGIVDCQQIASEPVMRRIDVNVDGGHPGGHAGGDEVLMRHLYESMIQGLPPRIGVEEGIRSAVVSFAIDEALDTGRVVDLAPWWKKAGIRFPG
jgi:predicted dehydrogenase